MSIMKVAFFGSKNESKDFDPARDIKPLTGQVILITGAAGDLGRQTAIDLGRYGRPAQIVIADLPRDEQGKAAAISAVRTALPADVGESLRLDYLEMDLGSLESVRAAAARFLAIAKGGRLDVLVLNAGIMPVKAGLTADGYERVFGVNYLGHALLARLLLPAMQQSRPPPPEPPADSADQPKQQKQPRIVIVASEGHAMAPKGGIQFSSLKTDCKKMGHFGRYGQSKVALIALARELARRYPAVRVAAVHPGRITTGLSTELVKESLLIRMTGPLSRFVVTTVELGARNQVWAATSDDVVSGLYYVPVGIADPKTVVDKDEALAGKLWEWTDKELEDVQW